MCIRKRLLSASHAQTLMYRWGANPLVIILLRQNGSFGNTVWLSGLPEQDRKAFPCGFRRESPCSKAGQAGPPALSDAS